MANARVTVQSVRGKRLHPAETEEMREISSENLDSRGLNL